MRRARPVLLILLVLGLVGSSARAEDAPESPEALARVLLKALRAKDVTGIVPTLPTEADVTWVLAEIERTGSDEEFERARASIESRGGAASIVAATRKRAGPRFERTRKEAGEHLDWTDARYDGIETKKLAMPGVESVTISLFVVSRGARFRFEIRDAGRVERGWIAPDGAVFTRCVGCLTQEAAARHAFEALRRYEYGRFLPLVPLQADLAAPLEGEPPEGAALEALVTGTLRKNKASYEAAFARTRGKIDWNRARFGGLDPTRTKTVPVGKGERGDIWFTVVDRQTRYAFRFPAAVRTARGWTTPAGLRYEGVQD